MFEGEKANTIKTCTTKKTDDSAQAGPSTSRGDEGTRVFPRVTYVAEGSFLYPSVDRLRAVVALDSNKRRKIDEKISRAERKLKDIQTRVRISLEQSIDKGDLKKGYVPREYPSLYDGFLSSDKANLPFSHCPTYQETVCIIQGRKTSKKVELTVELLRRPTATYDVLKNWL